MIDLTNEEIRLVLETLHEKHEELTSMTQPWKANPTYIVKFEELIKKFSKILDKEKV